MTLDELIYALREYASPRVNGMEVVITKNRKQENGDMKVIPMPLDIVLEIAANELEKMDTEAYKFRHLKEGIKKYSPDLYEHIMGEIP